ncbi:Allantoicase [Dispira simplex]|nr:Allantoicase [Dispira simplex]
MGNQHSSELPPYYNADPTNEATHHTLSRYTDLASDTLGSKVVAVSDEFFVSAANLIKSHAPVQDKVRMTDQGAWYDGWETRRHNPKHDWVIIRLGYAGTIAGFNIDTAHFNGNHAPEASVEACFVAEGDKKDPRDYPWEEVLPKVPLGPSSQHLLALWNPPATLFNHVRLNIYPDGGVARFRVFGNVKPQWFSISPETILDLAAVGHGGRAVACSNAHFSAMSNLLLPGRGISMKDGWETARSREENHSDWVVIRLGTTGYLHQVELDTYQFKGNFPQAASLQACYSLQDNPDDDPDCFWFQVLSKSRLEGHQLHEFPVELKEQPFTHVKLSIYPDGGIKRLRVYGRRCTEQELQRCLQERKPLASPTVAMEVVSTTVVNAATTTLVTMADDKLSDLRNQSSPSKSSTSETPKKCAKNVRPRDENDNDEDYVAVGASSDSRRNSSASGSTTPKRAKKSKTRA